VATLTDDDREALNKYIVMHEQLEIDVSQWLSLIPLAATASCVTSIWHVSSISPSTRKVQLKPFINQCNHSLKILI